MEMFFRFIFQATVCGNSYIMISTLENMTARQLWRPNAASLSRREHAKCNYSKMSLSFSYMPCTQTKLSRSTDTFERPLELGFKRSSGQRSVNPQGTGPRFWKVQMLLVHLFILRMFQGPTSARMPYVRGHRGAL